MDDIQKLMVRQPGGRRGGEEQFQMAGFMGRLQLVTRQAGLEEGEGWISTPGFLFGRCPFSSFTVNDFLTMTLLLPWKEKFIPSE